MDLLVNIDVDDLERAIRFHVDAFGLRVGRRFGADAVELLGASAPIYLLQKAPGSPATAQSNRLRDYARHWTPVHLDVVVEDIAAAVERATRAGATLEQPIRSQKWGRLALMADPFGHGFCLVQFSGRGYDEISDVPAAVTAQEATLDVPDYEAFFREYAKAYERSLGDSVDTVAIRGFFAEAFVSAGVRGQAAAGGNDEAFEQALTQGFGFYKAIGTTSMAVERVEAEALCENHDRVRVFYSAGYRKKDGTEVSIPFDVLYLIQRRSGGPKIFGFIAGDEMAAYRQHGLVDESGQPA